MKQENKGYEGFWKNFGCTLTIVVGLVFLGIFLYLLNMMFFKFQF